MKRTTILLLMFSVLTITAGAQISFHRTFEGLGAERGYSVEVCPDGYLLTGSTNSAGAGQNDVLVIKTGLNGAPVWQKNYGGPGNDIGVKAARVSDGNYVIAGSTFSFTPDSSNFYVLKIDSLGALIWSAIFGGPGKDSAATFIETSDNGLLIAGITTSIGAGNSDIYLLKLDSAGNYLWSKAIGNTGNDILTAVLEMDDGGFLITGYTDGFGFNGNTPLLLRTNGIGDVQWTKTYNPPAYWASPKNSRFNNIIRGYLGDYVVIGQVCCDNVGAGRSVVMDIDSLGNPNWVKDYMFNSGRSEARSIIKSSDGQFLVGGLYSGGTAKILKINVLGVPQWVKTYNANQAFDLKATTGNQFVLTGYNTPTGDSKMFLLSPEFNGNLICQNGTTFTLNAATTSFTSASQTFFSTTTNYGIIDSCSVSISPIGTTSLCLYTGTHPDPVTDETISISPVPAGDFITLTINETGSNYLVEIYNTHGKHFYSDPNAGNFERINISSYAPGIYILKISDGSKVSTLRFVKL